ncbi:hypothetical protein QJS10_CPB12g00739 [Acorus calamus]|uniref:Uncharacterized protein n=1 Tax=Acorus calamus TaxID=4465 RepID=A0AAV9DNQ4_ACOCL|nr:hypothetical protein QJS10_CPB12g00739 [Acorus calamus]
MELLLYTLKEFGLIFMSFIQNMLSIQTPEQVGPEYVVNSGAYHFSDKNESTIGDDLIESNDAKRKLKGGFKKFMSEPIESIPIMCCKRDMEDIALGGCEQKLEACLARPTIRSKSGEEYDKSPIPRVPIPNLRILFGFPPITRK